VVVELDPKTHEEALANQKANLARIRADREKARQNELKDVHKAEDEVQAHRLRVDLETLRLKEMELGPAASDELNAKVNLENAKALLVARGEEFEILTGLANDGFVSKSEVRQKELDLRQQEVAVAQSELAYKKLETLDPVQIADQKLKVRDEEKSYAESQQRAALLAKNNKDAETRHQTRTKREEQRLKELEENVTRTKVASPVPGVALQRSFWGMQLGPGREVRDGWEVMTISDLRKMKVALTVDEGRIARVRKEMKASVRPTGSGNDRFDGTVTLVAEKGRDEFEDFRQETQDIVGKAQRQVFDVEVEIEGESLQLRPGLRVDVEIVVQRIEKALIVPRAALVREKDGQAYVRLAGALGPERKPVTVLGESELAVAVEGLEEGQRVWLVEP
jgi:multidrug efflux pump subunit AcrA (membrane-fusion protein)